MQDWTILYSSFLNGGSSKTGSCVQSWPLGRVSGDIALGGKLRGLQQRVTRWPGGQRAAHPTGMLPGQGGRQATCPHYLAPCTAALATGWAEQCSPITCPCQSSCHHHLPLVPEGEGSRGGPLTLPPWQWSAGFQPLPVFLGAAPSCYSARHNQRQMNEWVDKSACRWLSWLRSQVAWLLSWPRQPAGEGPPALTWQWLDAIVWGCVRTSPSV